MDSAIFVLNINNVHGVSAYLDNEKIRLMFRSSLQLESWHSLLRTINELIQANLLNWNFDLTKLEYPSSTDIGMWVTCVSRIKLKSGKIVFIVQKESNIHMLLEATNLMKIFDVVLVM